MSLPRHADLHEAREALEYWERRLQGLPRRDRRGRREAAEHVQRARRRVAEAERHAYGQGVSGTVMQLAAEGRLPEPLRDTGRRVARHGRRAAIAAVAVTVAFAALLLAVAVAIVVALL